MTLSREQILASIADVLRTDCRINRSTFHESDRLIEDLGLESMGLWTLATRLENDLAITLDEDPEAPPATLKAIIDLIEARLTS